MNKDKTNLMSLASLFHHLLLNMFRMLIHPSSGPYDLLWIYFMCWCYGVVRLEWCGILMQAEAVVQLGWCGILMQAEAVVRLGWCGILMQAEALLVC
jgi:hypothetical protein